jgi:hypothetical protein
MKTFGASAPLKELQKKFGFTVEAVVAQALEALGWPEAHAERARQVTLEEASQPRGA